MYKCPVPKDKCSGTLKQVEPGNKTEKVHASQAEIKRCVRHYLTSMGYTPCQNGEYHKGDGPVLMVPKKCGAYLRKGKGTEGSKSGARLMHKRTNLPITAF